VINDILHTNQELFTIEDFKPITMLQNHLDKQKGNFIVLGTGASSIIPKIFKSNAISKNNLFFCDNIDPFELQEINEIDNKNLIIISKSGNTHEVLVMLKYLNINEVKSIVFISDSNQNLIAQYLNNKNLQYTYINHPKTGGRFSIFSVVAFVGIYFYFKAEEFFKLSPLQIIQDNMQEFKDYLSFIESVGNKNLILMHYGNSISYFTSWIEQIYQESLGKNQKGFNVFTSKGTIDQHSKLQMYLDGHLNNAFFMYYNSDANFQDFYNHYDATYKALLSKDLIITKKELCFSSLSDLYKEIYKHLIAVMYLSNLFQINPFGQPSVEIMKKHLNSVV
jgi:glucose-6-phosphate isomerase